MAMSGFDPSAMAPGLGALGAGIGSLFAPYEDPSKKAMGFFNKIPGQLKENFNPWIQMAMGMAQNPAERLNQIGQGYQQSPGFKFALQQALQGSGHAAAAGGMAGSPQHEQQNMELATNLANQDYNQWMQNALGLQGLGMGIGSQGGMRLGEDLASVLAQQGKLGFEGQQAKNEREGGIWGSLAGGAASLLPLLFL